MRDHREGLDSTDAPPTLDELLARGDLDGLIRAVDAAADRRDWQGIADIRRRSRLAIERGHQLWPATTWAEYRLALEAPGPDAAAVLVESAGHFAIGPLSEVVASAHTWDDLAEWIEPGPLAAIVAQERVLRGEDLRHDPRVPTPLMEVPATLQPWEPTYCLATYTLDGIALDRGELDRIHDELTPAEGSPLVASPASDETRALESLVDHWASGSSGRRRAVEVDGSAFDAVATLLDDTPMLAAEVTLADAMAIMADAAATGAAHGRRRGAATGRQAAWWCVAVLAGMDDDWGALDADDLGRQASELRWFTWAPADHPATGWQCRIAVEDPADGLAWALDASDSLSPGSGAPR